jgi:RHS repeat-associated protein
MNKQSKSASRLAVLASALMVAVLGSTYAAQAQTTPNRGFQPAGSYATTDLETINTTNGNLMYHIPLAGLPTGRGGNPGAKLTLVHNSSLWDSTPEIHRDPLDPTNLDTNYTLNVLGGSAEGGWHYGLGYSYRVINRFDQYAFPYPQCPDLEATYQWKVVVIFPDGSSHEFVPVGYSQALNDGFYQIRADGYVSGCPTGTGSFVNTGVNYYSTDGTYAFMNVDVDRDANGNPAPDNYWWNNLFTIYFGDGTKVVQSSSFQKIYDRNGNSIKIQSITWNGHAGTEVIDELNRHFVIEYSGSQDLVHTWGVDNVEMVTTVHWKDVWVYKSYTATMDLGQHPTTKELFTSEHVVDSIILPTQASSLTYLFAYNASDTQPTTGHYTNGWGNINQVTLPSGGSASYTYLGDGANAIFWTDALQNSPTGKDLHYLLEYDGSSTPTTEHWSYSTGTSSSFITAPDGGTTNDYYYDTATSAPGSKGLVYKSIKSDGTVVERIWVTGWNSFVKTEFTSIKDSSANLVKTAIRDYSQDKNGNVTRVAEYDWIDYVSIQRDANNMPLPLQQWSNPPTPARVTVNTYYSPTPDSSSTNNSSPDIYSNPLSPRLRNALESTEVQDGSGQAFSRVEHFYDNNRLSGNLTTQKTWDSNKGAISRPLFADGSNSISVLHTYDSHGNPLYHTDGRTTQTQLTYDANALYPIQTVEGSNKPVHLTTTRQFDFYTGVITLSTDTDNNVSIKTTYDVFGRPILVQDAYNTALERRTSTEYSDSLRRVIVRSDLNSNDGLLVSVQHYDQLGRLRLSRTNVPPQSATDETTGTKVQTRYVNASPNSYELVSNPYNASTSAAANAEETMGWSRTKRDAGSRVVEIQTFSGSGLPAPWGTGNSSTGNVATSYNGIYATVVDQATRQRRSMTDGLGRLIRVDEPDAATGNLDSAGVPVQSTSYSYDPLDDLVMVTQQAQQRTFKYDSMKRLIRVRNPEQGTNATLTTGNTVWSCGYTYDENSNLITRIDARDQNGGITTTYAYDPFNRVISRSYQNDPENSPAVFYYYDSQTLPVGAPSYNRGQSAGKLVAVTYGSASAAAGTYYAYDQLGRTTASFQVTDTSANQVANYQTYQFGYGYNLAGKVITETYPSGRVIATEYDNFGRIGGVKNQNTQFYYAGGPSGFNWIQYAAHGALKRMLLGNGNSEHTNFNSRLQAVQIGVGPSFPDDSSILKLDYGYGAAASNNGNLITQTITVPNSSQPGSTVVMNQSYAYDYLNRITQAQENTPASWAESFQYDRYGNMWVPPTGCVGITLSQLTPQSSGGIDTNTNHLTASLYDRAGNQSVDALNRTFGYDAENRQIKFNSTTQACFYDGDGHRVKKIDGSETTVFVYNATGQLIGEYTTSTSTGGDANYITTDDLGSTRLVTGSGGSVKVRYDYIPFGAEIPANLGGRPATVGYGAADTTRQKFTQKERDADSTLDYFLARYYSSAQGRFTSVDFAGPDVDNPQTLNKYRYGLNNPFRYIDQNGLYERDVHQELTAALAYSAGFSQSEAARIGQADQYVDDNPETSPMQFALTGPPYAARRDYHFTTEARRDALWSAFESSSLLGRAVVEDSEALRFWGADKRTAALDALGTYLHAQQDSYSHAGYGPLIGHLAQGHAPDKTYNDVAKANAMALDTYQKLLKASSLLRGTSSPISYSGFIENHVNAFNRARTIQEKRSQIFIIVWYVRRNREATIQRQNAPIPQPLPPRTLS